MGGVERVAAAFAAAGGESRAALMPYLMGGFPDHETSAAVARSYADAGADLIELGVPFSDPLADGPVIHDAAVRALESGATLKSVLALGAEVASDVPVVVMAYANMVLARGQERFASDLEAAGFAGVIVPDLPPEEATTLRESLSRASLAFIPLVGPTTPAARRRSICAAARGFVYVVSDTRTTGERDSLPTGLTGLVAAVRGDAEVPVAVGFGIGTPEQAADVGKLADGVIVGSRLVRAVAEAGTATDAAAAAADFIAAARAALLAPAGATPLR